MLETMSLAQFYEWQAFYQLEPWGHPAEDTFHARQIWATLRAAGGKEFKAQPGDFLVRPPEAIEIEVDPIEHLQRVFAAAAARSPEPEPAEASTLPAKV